jgi:large subunit ribosomal protein L13
MGNMRSFSFEKMMEKAPQDIITIAVKGMLPKNPLGRAMLGKLKVFAGPTHNHQAQQPQTLDI